MPQNLTVRVPGVVAADVGRVLKNTYLLLSLCLAFSALCALGGMAMNVPYMGFIPYLVGFFGLSWVVQRTANSSWGIVWSFVFVGFLGIAIAPILQFYLAVHPLLVVQALGLTASTFVGLSIYTIVKRADFSWLGQFLTAAFFVILGLIVLSFFVDISGFQALVSGFMVFVASALILWQTSRIVLGGETNYILAANTLFVSVYILFTSLLSLLGIFGGDD